MVYKVSGIFSASISHIFEALRRGVPLSKAVADAVALGLCEPDPRDDLAGVDVRRMLVVLGRELGLSLEVDDVECESLLPAELSDWEPDRTDDAPPLAAQLCAALEPFDAQTAEKIGGMLQGHTRSACTPTAF